MQVMDFSALGAQAVAQVERAQRAAREQVMAAMNQRPKLSLKLQLEGPKIAVPVPASGSQGKAPELQYTLDLAKASPEPGSEGSHLSGCLHLDLAYTR